MNQWYSLMKFKINNQERTFSFPTRWLVHWHLQTIQFLWDRQRWLLILAILHFVNTYGHMIQYGFRVWFSDFSQKSAPPYLKLFLSCPFYALIAGQFGNQYILFLALTIVPQYLKRVLGFNLKTSAAIAALPHVSRLVFGFIFGSVNDFLLQRGVPKKYCRKGFTIFCKYHLDHFCYHFHIHED